MSDHFDGRVFFNPGGVAPRPFGELLRWQFTEKRARWPVRFDSAFAGTRPDATVQGPDLVVTMIGHATLLIQTNGVNLITDPVYSERASPLRFAGPRRVNPPGVAFDDLPKIDAVLLSHNHYDHLDIATLGRLVARDNPKIVTPLGNDVIVGRAVPGADIASGDWGDSLLLGADTRIHFEPCHHWSARGTRDRRMALWAAFVIETPTAKIYHVADTGFHRGINYRAAARRFAAFDLAILPVGAYEPRWFMEGQHQNPAEAVEGLRLCNAAQGLGHHWGTFQLTNEAVDAPKLALEVALTGAGMVQQNFLPLVPGQVWRRQTSG